LVSAISRSQPVLEAALGDITTERVDAVINATNERLVAAVALTGQSIAPPARANCTQRAA
jgi:hypothetical protein